MMCSQTIISSSVTLTAWLNLVYGRIDNTAMRNLVTRSLCLVEGLRFTGRLRTEEVCFSSPSNRSGILLEVEVLECEMRLHDAGGLHSGPQHVLLRGDVLALGYPLKVVQVAGGIGRTGDKKTAVYWSRTTSVLLRVHSAFITIPSRPLTVPRAASLASVAS